MIFLNKNLNKKILFEQSQKFRGSYCTITKVQGKFLCTCMVRKHTTNGSHLIRTCWPHLQTKFGSFYICKPHEHMNYCMMLLHARIAMGTRIYLYHSSQKDFRPSLVGDASLLHWILQEENSFHRLQMPLQDKNWDLARIVKLPSYCAKQKLEPEKIGILGTRTRC